MGNPRLMHSDGGFSKYLYCDHEQWSALEMNGITAKVVRNIADPEGLHTSLPLSSGKSRLYLRLDKAGNPVQARLYINRRCAIDFDWGHSHYNNPKKGGDGKVFNKGIVHVQEYKLNSDGSSVRISENARLANDAEIKTLGSILKSFYPNIKFK